MSKNNREARFSHADLKLSAWGVEALGFIGVSCKLFST
jgi:hypothetical protein